MPDCGFSTKTSSAFQHKEYMFRRKAFTFLGAAFHVYDESKNVIFYSRQKPFKLREDFRIYSDETMKKELLIIKTPHILDIWATYNVEDPTTGEKVGSIKRKALKSIIRDEWIICSPDEREIGKLTEKSWLGAIASRFINLIPQKYTIIAGIKEVADIKQHFNPFILRYTMSIITTQIIDARLLIAAGILLVGVERRQKN